MTKITVALDAMSGDYGPSVVVPAALTKLNAHDNLRIILVGNEQILRDTLNSLHAQEDDNLIIHHASQVVAMDEEPRQALRTKKDSSMRVAINLIKSGDANACVSAGNTGALMATARFVLRTVPGIDRPAISALLPTMQDNRNVRVLDLGANVDSTAEQLFQFAAMASILTASTGNIEKPAVALLNVGEEAIKGNEQVKQTDKLLSEAKQINYIGYVEGDDIYKGTADVIVCDGFVGNVALKTSEGLAKLLSQYLKDAFQRNWLTKLSGLAAKHVLKSVAKRLDPSRYNGASLLGLKGIVIKSHGGANDLAFANAINEAILEIENNIPELISSQIGEILQSGS